jgi:2-dehydropantoate 2-reductase
MIREHGLAVTFPDGEVVARAPVLSDVRDAAGLGADVAVVAVKAASLAEVAEGVGAALAPDGVALPLLNGLDSEEELAKVIGRSRVIGGVAQIAASVVAPGRVLVEAPAEIVLAPLANEQMPLVERLAETFSRAGFGCTAKRDLARVLWVKLLWNAPFNAVCALTRRTAGEVLRIPDLEALVKRAMEEVRAVARAEGVAIDERVVTASLDATRSRFQNTRPSMLQDVLAGRPTEARALQGAVVTRAARHGIPTPVHETLLALLLGLDEKP